MRILFFGDVVGRPGRRALVRSLPVLRERHTVDCVIANGENSAGGLGITPSTADELFDAGVDAITLGNHTFRHREVYGYLDQHDAIVRPANLPASSPGRGECVVEVDGIRVGIVNLMGAVHLDVVRSPFVEADAALSRLDGRADVVWVDFHAEITSEKVAMGWHLDGRVAAVVGTHTHVPTADARVLPGGTAHICDVGMTGSRAGVIGVKRDQALSRFRTMMPVRFEGAEGDVWVNAVVVDVARDGRAHSIESIVEPVAELLGE